VARSQRLTWVGLPATEGRLHVMVHHLLDHCPGGAGHSGGSPVGPSTLSQPRQSAKKRGFRSAIGAGLELRAVLKCGRF